MEIYLLGYFALDIQSRTAWLKKWCKAITLACTLTKSQHLNKVCPVPLHKAEPEAPMTGYRRSVAGLAAHQLNQIKQEYKWEQINIWLFITVVSPGTGQFTVMSDSLEIERLIKDWGLFSKEPEDVSSPSGECQLHWNPFDLLELLCADSHTAGKHLIEMDFF